MRSSRGVVRPQERTGPSFSVPRALILGVLVLVGGNYYYSSSSSSSQPQRSPAAAPGSPDDATTRNLALNKLQSRLRERDATIRQLEAQIEEVQHTQHAALSSQPPPKRSDGPAADAPKASQPGASASAASAGTPSEAAPTSTAVVLRDELVDVPDDLVFPDALRKCAKGSDLFISFSSGSMAAFALNWVANLRRTGVVKVLVGALDEKMLEIAEAEGIPSMTLDGSSIKHSGAANLRFDYSAYKRMAALKVAFYTRILTMGFNIWACDADTGWMGDPSPFIQQYPMQHVDMLTTTDCIDLEGDQRGGCWHVDHNTGLVYMRSRPVVLEFTAAWKKKIETTRDIMVRDQAALNLLMREGFHSKTWAPPPDPQGTPPVRSVYLVWNEKLKLARLPLKYFANGHSFFVQRMYAKPDSPPPFVVHMTYQYGDSSKFPYGKRQRMREARVWQVDPPAYFGGGKYLAVAPEAASLPIDYMPKTCTTGEAAERFNKEEQHLRRVLRDSLALAIALNRTLVLPRMLCYCDNIWKEMKHCRVGGAFDMTLPFDCPSDHIINLVGWFDSSLPVDFREPGFLSDPRLAPEIVASWTRVNIHPMTSSEARAALAPFAESRVLELGNAKETFCGYEQPGLASLWRNLAPKLVPYSRHFCQEDATPDACIGPRPGCVPYYAPCCHGAAGRHFPCKYLVQPPGFPSDASNPPEFCKGRPSGGGVISHGPRPADYPDLSPNPRSRHFHKYVDTFNRK